MAMAATIIRSEYVRGYDSSWDLAVQSPPSAGGSTRCTRSPARRSAAEPNGAGDLATL